MATRVRQRQVQRDTEASLGVNIRSLNIGAKRVDRADTSRQADDHDAFAIDGIGSSIIATPFVLENLSAIYDQSNVLRQCVSAMVTNVALNGFRTVPIRKGAIVSEEEKAELESFIESANLTESLVGVHSKLVEQYEKFGFGYVEVVRDRKNRPTLLKHCKTSNIRATKRNGNAVTITTQMSRGGRRSTIKERVKFRRYVQRVGTNTVYFKEFGDPRKMSLKTGKYASKAYSVPVSEEATELLHRRQISEDAYGLPRWISQLPSILGSREAEEVNLRYFEDNTVPPMIMSVAGGRLTRESYIQLQAILNAQGVGRERQNQIILVEAVPEVSDLEGKGSVSLQIDKLTDVRQGDGLFDKYGESNIAKVRSSFRLPPVFLGMSQDITFATANVSAYLAEVQVFHPERTMHDEFYNKNFVNHPNGLNLKTVKLESKGPTVTNPEQVLKVLTAGNVMGAVTPRSAIDSINETMQLSLPQYPEPGTKEWLQWMDEPIAFSLKKGTDHAHTHDEQAAKDQDIKDREAEGDILPAPVEHGQE
jgi:PBSX family phage portal protein